MIIDTPISNPQEALELTLGNQTEYERHIMQAARGNIDHFTPLYERYFPRVYAYCLRRVGDPREAEDLTSQIFVQVLIHLDQYRGGLVAAWLFRIAHNTVINQLKGRRPASMLEETLVTSHDPEPLEQLIQAEEQQALWMLVAALPEAQQDILLLKVVGGLSSKEIGELVGKTAGSIRVMLHRIIRELYARYQQQGGTPHAAE